MKSNLRFLIAWAVLCCPSLNAATTILAAAEVGPIKSTDGGLTWQIIPVTVNSGLLAGQPSAGTIAVDPKTPNTTWYTWGTVSGTYGFFKTADAGQTWSGTPLAGFQPFHRIAIDPELTAPCTWSRPATSSRTIS